MPDLPIVIPDTAVAPKDYTLSGTQELALKTVRALIDGSAAGSAFLPTLQLLDPNGHVMWEGATPSTVAAGGSADVSWFPGLGGTSGSSSIVTPAASVYLEGILGFTFVGNAGANLPWEFFDTTNTSVFGTSQNVPGTIPPHNTTGDITLLLLRGGSYTITASAQWPGGTTNIYADLQTNFTLHASDGNDASATSSLASNASPTPTLGTYETFSVHNYFVQPAAVPAYVNYFGFTTVAGNITVGQRQLVAHWYGNDASAMQSVY